MKKKYLAVMACAVMLLTGCEKKNQDMVTIGISQFAEHGSLDNCVEGFLEGLQEEGFIEGENLIVKINNANADIGTASQIAQNFVGGHVDLICAIATPSAQTAFNATMDTDIPVIYSAVTNPIRANLADEKMNPIGNVTGTSDKLPIEAQLKLIKTLLPNVKKIGILYTTSEANSIDSLENYKKLAEDYDVEILAIGITNISEVSLALTELLNKVDCLTNLTDNTVVSALPSILYAANEKNIPVFGSEIEQVKMGCIAAEGLDYKALGKETGKMAAKVLKKEMKAEDMKFKQFDGNTLYLNEEVAEKLSIVLPNELKEKAIMITEEMAEK